MPRKQVPARRFDARGRDVERVILSVNRVGGSVFLSIEGEKLSKDYVMSLEDWQKLTSETA